VTCDDTMGNNCQIKSQGLMSSDLSDKVFIWAFGPA